MKWMNGGVTAALGFRASAVNAGIKRLNKPDLSLVVADELAVAAAVVTRNRVKAAPVLISQERIRAGQAQAILLNSGCANCMTGVAGLRDAMVVSRSVAGALRLTERHVLMASTGMIGQRLPVARMLRSIPALVQHLHRANHTSAALGILTTDLKPKEAAVEARIHGSAVRVGGMAKGSGMIAPSMATMLCVMTTDAAVAPSLLRRLLRQAAARTFNQITIDGDMSTNDTVFALASGRSGARVTGAAQKPFVQMLQAVMERLALMIVSDGEGATRMAEIIVEGARTEGEASRCARSIANSPLVKTMVAGADPNVGRVAAAAGASGAVFDPNRLDIWIEGQRMVVGGVAVRLSAAVSRRLMQGPSVRIHVHLHAGRAASRMRTCDLTEEYVHINARYST
ncbi:MAG: bifunctional glutamate N-acetyltransferase/amino-acid acetyltransferase ArgJ [Candidatus Omnitrophica bacterium]|nr:bifunctional glutamate N-acetyltransferase/amino-acid acetyltransferase ArgJ [Candidatus Omnitrophota bacterium]